MTSKFVIADPSLRDHRGHHYELTARISEAAAKCDHPVLVFANRDAVIELQHAEVRSVFSATMYDAYRPAAATVQNSLQRRLLKLRGILFGVSGFSRLLHSLRRTLLVNGLLPSRVRPGVMARELLQAIEAARLDGDDHVFFHTADGITYLAVLELLLQRSAQALPMFHLCTPYDVAVMPNKVPGFGPDHIVTALDMLGVLGRTVHLYAENRRLADYYAFRWGLPVGVLEVLPVGTPAPGTDTGTINVIYLGAAREEKGFLLLPGLVADFSRRYSGDRQVHFTIQSTPQIIGYTEKIRAAIEALRQQGNHVRLVDDKLSSPAYKAMLATADIILLPYAQEKYRVRGSGIAVEAVSQGKIILTTTDTFMASLITRDNGVAAEDLAGYCKALLALVEDFDRFRDNAHEAAREYAAQHTLQGYVKTITGKDTSGPGDGERTLVYINTATLPAEALYQRITCIARYFSFARCRHLLLDLTNPPLPAADCHAQLAADNLRAAGIRRLALTRQNLAHFSAVFRRYLEVQDRQDLTGPPGEMPDCLFAVIGESATRLLLSALNRRSIWHGTLPGYCTLVRLTRKRSGLVYRFPVLHRLLRAVSPVRLFRSARRLLRKLVRTARRRVLAPLRRVKHAIVPPAGDHTGTGQATAGTVAVPGAPACSPVPDYTRLLQQPYFRQQVRRTVDRVITDAGIDLLYLPDRGVTGEAGMSFILDEVWPRVKTRCPQVNLVVPGPPPPAGADRHGDVRFVDAVPVPSLMLACARVVLADNLVADRHPLRWPALRAWCQVLVGTDHARDNGALAEQLVRLLTSERARRTASWKTYLELQSRYPVTAFDREFGRVVRTLGINDRQLQRNAQLESNWHFAEITQPGKFFTGDGQWSGTLPWVRVIPASAATGAGPVAPDTAAVSAPTDRLATAFKRRLAGLPGA